MIERMPTLFTVYSTTSRKPIPQCKTNQIEAGSKDVTIWARVQITAPENYRCASSTKILLIENEKNHLQDRKSTFIMLHSSNIVLSGHAFAKAPWQIKNELHICGTKLLEQGLCHNTRFDTVSPLKVKEVTTSFQLKKTIHHVFTSHHETQHRPSVNTAKAYRPYLRISDLRLQALKGPM